MILTLSILAIFIGACMLLVWLVDALKGVQEEQEAGEPLPLTLVKYKRPSPIWVVVLLILVGSLWAVL
jgi:hypothetical protein